MVLSPGIVPPFRDERRWGNTFENIFDAGTVGRSSQLISVNEVPSRVWDLLFVLEPTTGAGFVVDTVVNVNFTVTVGVGSSTNKFVRTLAVLSQAALAAISPTAYVGMNPQTYLRGAIETLVLPASSFIVECLIQMSAGPGQAFPVTARAGVYAAPRMPRLASLESAELVLE
jgi:hypothetical protein